ncbi:FILIA-N KH-like domain-containing protein isoform X1 [Hoplias malabaricus]|uniref:FILIA-N KH-like domain-containing protein isoform X1 n=1 Tax=Hoplias malabaricus TaxID=27720 RepID=UPI0034624792
MTIEAPVILSALLFTIIAVILASLFLARKQSSKNEKQKEDKAARPEREAEVCEPPVKPTEAEERREKESFSAPAVVEETGATEKPTVLEAEVASVQAQLEDVPVPDPLPEVISASAPVEMLASVLELHDAPIPESIPKDTFPESVPELVSEQVSESITKPASETDTEQVLEANSGLNLESAPEVSEPAPETVPQLTTESVSEPIPVSKPALDQVSEHVPEPVLEGTPKVIAEPTPGPVSEPTPGPVSEPTPGPVSEPTPGPVSEPTPGPVSEPTPGPVSEPTPGPVSEPTPGPVSEPTPGPVSEPTPGPVSEPTPGPVSEPTPGPVSEYTPEPVSEPTLEPVSKSISEPLSEQVPEVFAEPAQNSELIVESSELFPEQISEATNEPELVSETLLEFTPTPALESVPVVAEHNGVAAAPAISDGEALSFKPGRKLTAKLTKEELAEEQRVQREQLTAIFKLLKDNQETFGEVTEADIEEQLKLYTY